MMDPIFGLPIVKDSKAMDFARNKNTSQEKILRSRIDSLDLELRSKTSKWLVAKATARDFLGSINTGQSKKVVCPKGMSSGDKDSYRKLRQASAPSMTLDQFDEKLSVARNRRLLQRGNSRERQANGSYASGTDTQEYNVVTPEDVGNRTVLPLYCCKTKVKDAMQRLSTGLGSASASSALRRRQRFSDSGIVYRSISSSSGMSATTTKAPGMTRRNTLPDLQKWQGQTDGVRGRVLQPISDLENEAFDRFLLQMKEKSPQVNGDR